MNAPRTILLVKLSAIGDVLHGVPAAVAIKDAFPAATVGWVVEGRSADVLEGHRAINRVFRLPRGWAKRPAEILRLRRDLRAFAPDVTIDMQGLFKSMVATALSAARTRIGFARPESREQAWLAYTHAIRPTAAHIMERHCQLLAPLGVEARGITFDMPRWPVSRSRVTEWFRDLRFEQAPILLNPGAGWASKLWPTERFAAVARDLRRRHGVRSLVVWGGGDERVAAERIVAAAGDAAVLAPATSLQDLGEVCRLARLFVSSDTGPLHLAAAVGTPCVGLFGPVPAARNGPYGSRHVNVEPPQHLRPAWENRKTDTQSMLGIEVAAVVAAAERQLARAAAAA